MTTASKNTLGIDRGSVWTSKGSRGGVEEFRRVDNKMPEYSNICNMKKGKKKLADFGLNTNQHESVYFGET